MKFNVISNLANGVGLAQDYAILRSALEARGHEVHGVQFNAPVPQAMPPRGSDVNVFVEVVSAQHFPLAREQWFIPHPEWFFWDQLVARFSRVLTKTRDTQRIFAGLTNGRSQYLGWRSRDLYRPEVSRRRKFLHLAGKSHLKNTEAVLECWHRFHPRAELVLVSEPYRSNGIPDVAHFHRVSDDELARLMNECLFHLMPAAYEGWGHALHEALGVGAVIITTDAPPMNEIPAAIFVPGCSTRKQNQAMLHSVSPEAVYAAVQAALAMSDEMVERERDRANAAFRRDIQEFNHNLDAIVGAAHVENQKVVPEGA